MTVVRVGSLQTSVQVAVGPTSRCDLTDDGRLVGFVFDPDYPERRFTVEVLLDGLVVATSYANRFVVELFEQRVGNGSYGFVVKFGSGRSGSRTHTAGSPCQYWHTDRKND